MPTTIALLRGVNVGGHNKVPMADLRAALEDVGYADVRTYVQSGNVVLRSRAGAKKVAADVHEAIEERFHLDIPVIARTVVQLKDIAAHNPFLRPDADPSRHLLVGFLDGIPAKAKVKALDPHRAAPEELRVRGTEVYFWCPDGWGTSKVSNGLEKALGTAMTARNWRTITTLLEMAGK